MLYLTKSEILRINKKVTLQFGGLFFPPNNLLNKNALDYTVDIVKSACFGQELYPTIYLKAALYKFNINCDHIFHDGNKRTGLESLLLFFEKNCITLSDNVTDEELVYFTFSVSRCELSVEEIANWYQERTKTI